MKNDIKTFLAGVFVATALPFVLILLLNGRQGIHQEKQLDAIDYAVLRQMLAEDISWMDDDTLKLLAVLYRTEQMRLRDQEDSIQTEASEEQYAGWQAETYGETYTRIYQAVENTAGMVVMINGEYKELPFHKISAGKTRDGRLLGEEYAYIRSVECREDKDAQDYLQVCILDPEEIWETLTATAKDLSEQDHRNWLEQMEFQRDEEGYIESVCLGEQIWTGEAFRTILHFSSSCFWMDRERSAAEDSTEGKIRVTVKGSGHGFGISLYTADQWIREGKPWQDIFSIFYENAQCITIP